MSITIKVDNGDMVADSRGVYATVRGVEKCAQDIAESLLNNWDSDIPPPYNGSDLYLIDRNPVDSTDAGVETLVYKMVDDAIDRLMDLQDVDDYVDVDEVIDRIDLLTVKKVGPMSWYFYLRVITESEEFVPYDYQIQLSQQLPDSVAAELPRFLPGTDRSKTYM